MDRRHFMAGAAAGAGAAAAFPGRLGALENRPNILLILVDQLRTNRWTPDLRTPNIGRLAARGVSFTNHFVSATPCSPSRACLVTGTYTTQNKMYSNCDFVEGTLQPSLDPRIPTFGHVFGRAGYQTPYRGKWHLTRRADRDRQDPLIDYGFTGWSAPDAFFGGPPYCGAVFDPMYTRQSVQWLLDPDNHKKPWFKVASLVNPHDICAYPRYVPQWRHKDIRTDEPPPNYIDDLRSKPPVQREHADKYTSVGGNMDLNDPDAWRRYLDYYMHCIEDMDENLGDILDALEKSGQAGNTIVVFTSDHGEMGGSHQLRTKGNFMYEEVMNVPLIFAWPGRLPEGVVTGAMASNVDVMPTLVEMAGIYHNHYMPGVDLGRCLDDPKADSPREFVICHNDWESEFTIGKSPEDNALYDHPSHVRCIRTAEWKYAYYFSPGMDRTDHELYNMNDDPTEMINLANDPGYKKKVKEFHNLLMEEEDRLVGEFEV